MYKPVKFGKIYLLKLSLPIFLSNIAVPLVGIIDTGLMGHLGDSRFLAATSVGTSVITMILWSFGFFRMGTVGLVSQAFGRGDEKEIIYVLLRNLILVVFVSFAIILLKHPILYTIKLFFLTSNKTSILIENYVSIRLYAAPAELSLYVLTGLYLGLQKTKISSLAISLFCFLNILLSVFFVTIFKLNVSGVALGTLVSAYITSIIFLIFTYYFLNKLKIKITLKRILIKNKLIDLFKINFNIFIRTVLLTFSFLFFIHQSSKLGEDFIAINNILLQFILLASFFLDSYAYSTEGVVGFTIGKKSVKSFMKCVKNSFQLSILTGVLISILYIFLFKNIINILTDIEYLRFLAYTFVFWVIIIPPVASICYQFDGIFIGASQTKEIRNAMIISVFLFIITSYFLVDKFDNHGLWLSLLFFMIFRSISLNFYFNKILRKF
jgi:multidrug resistance protein, MATE family